MAMTLEALHGRVGDVDSHEMMPMEWYPEYFGEVGRRMVDENEDFWRFFARGGNGSIATAKNVRDDKAITEQLAWETKGVWAPGMASMDRRVEAMDAMGIRRQLIFPGFGHVAFIRAAGAGQVGLPPTSPAQVALAREAVHAHNKWAGQQTQRHPDRLSIVGMIESGEPGLTLDGLVRRAEDLIDMGVRAIQIFAGQPPAGLSPADPKLDPFYEALTKSKTTLVFHPPSWLGFRKSEVWELPLRPGLFVTNIYQAMENFLCVMMLGGVFDRHPDLRVGFIETGSSWIGPLCERLEMGPLEKLDLSHLKLRPREYLARNVRVAALLDEPFEWWLERYPYLDDVYCYCSDYPHTEGREWSLREAYKRVAPLGDTVVEKYFVKNSGLLFQ